MKKIKLLTVFFVLIMIVSVTDLAAQLRVDSGGNTTIKYGTFSSGNDAVLYLGDTNHYIKSVFGYGVYIGTGATNIIRIPQYTGWVGINRNPSYTLDVNGSIRADVTVYSSDERLKRDIKNLENTFEELRQIQGVSYTFTAERDSLYSKYDTGGKIKRHFGFIAQDFQKIFPDLVYKDSLGYLSIDYISIIPVLVEAVKQQQKTIEDMQAQLENCCQQSQLKSASITNGNEVSENSAELYQNTPNPFSLQTTIRFDIPKSVGNAQLYICSMTGSLIKSIEINQRGAGIVIIQANELSAGMYLYSLVNDGKIIDTKQMMLTN